MLAVWLAATPVFAHLVQPGHGTLNLVGESGFAVLSLPVRAFAWADTDHDGRLSKAEFDGALPRLARALEVGVTFDDGDGPRPLQDVLIMPSPTDAQPDAPAPDLVVLGRFPHPHRETPASLRITSLGEGAAAGTLDVLVTRGSERQTLHLTRDATEHWLLRGGARTARIRGSSGRAPLDGRVFAVLAGIVGGVAVGLGWLRQRRRRLRRVS